MMALQAERAPGFTTMRFHLKNRSARSQGLFVPPPRPVMRAAVHRVLASRFLRRNQRLLHPLRLRFVRDQHASAHGDGDDTCPGRLPPAAPDGFRPQTGCRAVNRVGMWNSIPRRVGPLSSRRHPNRPVGPARGRGITAGYLPVSMIALIDRDDHRLGPRALRLEDGLNPNPNSAPSSAVR